MRFRFPGDEGADESADGGCSSPFVVGIVAVSPPSSLLMVHESRRSRRRLDAESGREKRNTRLESRQKKNDRHSSPPTRG